MLRYIPEIPEDADIIRAALLYAKAGIYVLPVEPDDKRPAKFLRKGWQFKTSVDTEQIVSWFSGTPYLLGIHVGRSGFVVFDVDEYDVLPPVLLSEFSENPGPVQSTRIEGERGHRVYAPPPGVLYGNSTGQLRHISGEKWGEVRGANGIIVVEPSIHVKEGGRYKWIRSGPVPVLRPSVADLLPPINMDELNREAATDEAVRAFMKRHTAARNRNLLKGVIRTFVTEVREGASRHQSAVRAACWAMRDAQNGVFSAAEAAAEIRATFVPMLAGDKGRFPESEMDGILAFAVAQAGIDDQKARLRQREERLARNDEANGWAARTKRQTVELRDPYDGAVIAVTVDPEVMSIESAGITSSMADDHFENGDQSEDGRPRINMGDPAAAIAFMSQEIGRRRLSGMFRFKGQLVYAKAVTETGYSADETDISLRSVGADSLLAIISTRYNVGRVVTLKTGERLWKPVVPDRKYGTRLLGFVESGEAPHVREIISVTHSPILRPDGSILAVPGFDAATGILYLTDVAPPPIPDQPSATELAAARELIKFPIKDFPFVSEDDRANWIGCALTPLLRRFVPPPYQFGVIVAPSPGSGKSFLVGTLGAIHGVMQRSGFPAREEEAQKVIMTMLSSTEPIINFDNVRGTVKSPALEGLLTASTMVDRALGKNTEAIHVTNDRLWMMTGNNATLGGDLARRTLYITIDPQNASPHLRKFDIHPVEWAQAHRREYMAALLTVISAWRAAGSPKPSVARADGYATWIATVRGILEYAGIEGSFSSDSAAAETKSADDEEWGVFVQAVRAAFGVGTEFTAGNIYRQIEGNRHGKVLGTPISTDDLPGELLDRFAEWSSESKFIHSLAAWLRYRDGRYVDGLAIRKVRAGTSGVSRGKMLYKILSVESEGTA